MSQVDRLVDLHRSYKRIPLSCVPWSTNAVPCDWCKGGLLMSAESPAFA